MNAFELALRALSEINSRRYGVIENNGLFDVVILNNASYSDAVSCVGQAPWKRSITVNK